MLVIRNIDFESRSLAFEITDVVRPNWFGVVYDFLQTCSKLGFRTIDALCPAKMSESAIELLRSYAEPGVRVHTGEKMQDKPARADSGDVEFECIGPEGDGKDLRMEYTVRLAGFPYNLSCVNDFAVVCGKSASLTQRILTRLRLSVYELAANSVEHAMFASVTPKIEIRLTVTEQSITVDYRDNGSPFEPRVHDKSSFEEKVQRGSRRGLGLHFLQRLAFNMSFERKGVWNCTSFTLERRSRKRANKKRRNKVENFSVEIVPTEHRDALVLKPKGNLDSESTGVLERHIDAAVASGNTRVILDLSATDFISSSGVGLLLGSAVMLRQESGDLILVDVSPAVIEVLEIAGIDDFFRIVASLDEIGKIHHIRNTD